MKQQISMKEAISKVISEMDGVMKRKDIVDAVLKLYPSKAKDPANSIMSDFRFRPDIVQLGKGLYARVDYVLEGGKFRVKPTGQEIAAGILNYFWFVPFDHIMPPGESRFVDNNGQIIPLVTRKLDPDNLTDEQLKSMMAQMAQRFLGGGFDEAISALGLFDEDDDDFDEDDEWDEFDEDMVLEDDDEDDIDEEMIENEMLSDVREMLKSQGAAEFKGHDFSSFFEENRVKERDSIIVTMRPKENTYVFEHEPASEERKLVVRHHDREMNELIHDSIKRDKQAMARDVIFKAYGNFDWPKEYPSSHWMEIVEKDDQLRIISILGSHLQIASIEFKTMFDMFELDESTQRKFRKQAKNLREEIDDFCERFDRASEAAVGQLKSVVDEGGAANVVEPVKGLYVSNEFDEELIGIDRGLESGGGSDARAGNEREFPHNGLRVVESSDAEPDDEDDYEDESDYEKISDHNDELIDKFFHAGSKKKGSDSAAGRKAGDVSLFGDFLGNYHGCSLEYADYDMLEEFLFTWYPRKVLNASSSHAKHLALSLRDFYRFLALSGVTRTAKFAEVIYDMRDLAGEKVDLYDRLPQGEDFEPLFERLFGWGW